MSGQRSVSLSHFSPHTSHLLLPSPFGPLLVAYDAEGVRAVEFRGDGAVQAAAAPAAPGDDDALGRQIEREVAEYFQGVRRAFTLPLAPQGTPFQRRVWDALCRIPAGQTRTYAQVAASIGNARAVRAVGQANRRNPLPVLIPCHRVVAADGGLGGYMGEWQGGSGLESKRYLLRLEAGIRNDE
jgi:methylated-DNA-[protein]-cysteine S-methyltransferase